nr:MAG TPA: hypothetical protein [Caudoviricetes sp.]
MEAIRARATSCMMELPTVGLGTRRASFLLDMYPRYPRKPLLPRKPFLLDRVSSP